MMMMEAVFDLTSPGLKRTFALGVEVEIATNNVSSHCPVGEGVA